MVKGLTQPAVENEPAPNERPPPRESRTELRRTTDRRRKKAGSGRMSRQAASEKVKAGTCDKSTAEAKGACTAGKTAQEAAKKPAPGPKTSS
jgi:hypothetical protein